MVAHATSATEAKKGQRHVRAALKLFAQPRSDDGLVPKSLGPGEEFSTLEHASCGQAKVTVGAPARRTSTIGAQQHVARRLP